jgi:hypothetical protein
MKSLNALTALRKEIGRMVRSDDLGEIESGADGDGVVHSFSARNVGDWEVPADEEDDGDYDWKVPTADTVDRLNTLVNSMGRTHGVRLTWANDGEKCWLTFMAHAS